MKNKMVLIASAALIVGCSNPASQQYQQVYDDRHACNGDMEISHSVVIHSDELGKTAKPETAAVCKPQMYPTQTEFEKANRQKKH